MYPLFGYEEDNKIVGSKVAGFSLPEAHYKNENLGRKVVLIHFNEINQKNIE